MTFQSKLKSVRSFGLIILGVATLACSALLGATPASAAAKTSCDSPQPGLTHCVFVRSDGSTVETFHKKDGGINAPSTVTLSVSECVPSCKEIFTDLAKGPGLLDSAGTGALIQGLTNIDAERAYAKNLKAAQYTTNTTVQTSSTSAGSTASAAASPTTLALGGSANSSSISKPVDILSSYSSALGLGGNATGGAGGNGGSGGSGGFANANANGGTSIGGNTTNNQNSFPTANSNSTSSVQNNTTCLAAGSCK